MADAPISGLPETTTVGDNDLLLLQQNNTAKKIKGSNWKQYFNANVVTADASAIDPTDPPAATYDDVTNNLHLDLPTGDYFVSCEKTGSVGDTDTYTLTSALGHTATFQVVNGTGGSPSDTAPAALGTASAGISAYYSRGDHVHPMPSADMIQALALDGHSVEINFVQDLDNLVSGVGAFQPSTLNSPYSDTWGFVISAGDASYTRMQVAYPFSAAYPPKRRDLSGGVWSAWTYVMGSTTLPSALPVNMGGTGATTASAALANLGITDSGWIEVTFTEDFKNYGTTNKCQYRKFGNVVTVCGAATPVNDIAGSNTQYTMFTLPTGFRPKVAASSIQQGSGVARWQMQISTTGAVTFSRYADENGLATAAGGSPGAWLIFCMTFLTA